jgi:hypothetical protein
VIGYRRIRNKEAEMSHEKLDEGLRIFYEQMDERLDGLTPIEKQQYLEGLVHALDAITRYCPPEEVTPFERANFIDAVLSWAYSSTEILKLDSETRMRPLIESGMASVAKSYVFAAIVQQEVLGIPLNAEQSTKLRTATSLAANPI